jgi:hypothetical protein
LVGPTFNAILNDDWSKIAKYYSYTMVPFGRMLRDVNPYEDGNLIKNPGRFPEKLFGLPMMQLQRRSSEFFAENAPPYTPIR